MNYYERLNLKTNASIDEIMSKFRSLAKKYHPDLNKESNAQQIFIDIYEAYIILKDPKKKEVYDLTIKNQKDHSKKDDLYNWETEAKNEAKYYANTKYENMKTFWDNYDQGYYYFKEKKYNESIKCFSIALEIKKDNDVSYFFRSCSYNNIGNCEKALLDIDYAISINQKSMYYYFRGCIYADSKNDDMAIHDFNKSISIDDFPDAYKDRASIYFRRKNYDLAIMDLEKAIELNPKNARFYYNLAAVLKEGKNNLNMALYYYNIAIKIDKKFKEAYNNIGTIYYNLKKYIQAIEYYTKAIKLGEYTAYYNRANAFYLTAQYKNAINDYSEIIKINNDSDAYNNRGVCYKALGKYNEYKLDMEKARLLENKKK